MMEVGLHFPSYDLYGAKVTPLTSTDILALLESNIDAGRQSIVAYQNMHGLRVRLSGPAFQKLHDLPQTYVYIDGMPLVALCRLRGIPATRDHRVTGMDFFWQLLELAAWRKWRVYFIGAHDEVVRAGLSRIHARLPALELRAHHGFLDEKAESCVVRELASFEPHLVIIGMGMGRQEEWILRHLDAIGTASVWAAGACMEKIASTAWTPPRWIGRAGLEWLYRLAEDPRRFWHRYLVEPWIVLAYIVWHGASHRRGRIAPEPPPDQ